MLCGYWVVLVSESRCYWSVVQVHQLCTVCWRWLLSPQTTLLLGLSMNSTGSRYCCCCVFLFNSPIFPQVTAGPRTSSSEEPLCSADGRLYWPGVRLDTWQQCETLLARCASCHLTARCTSYHLTTVWDFTGQVRVLTPDNSVRAVSWLHWIKVNSRVGKEHKILGSCSVWVLQW